MCTVRAASSHMTAAFTASRADTPIVKGLIAVVQRLLSGKTETANPDYDRARFERALGYRFEIERTERLATRTLYEARP